MLKLLNNIKFLMLWLLLQTSYLFFLTATTQAQYQIEAWTTDRGLPQNTVHSITQTADGYLWLATLDGLVRFDGIKFRIFNKNNSKGIESNRFTRTIIDKHNNLWIGTENGSVTRYQNGTFQDFIINREIKKPIRNIALSKEGELIVLYDTGIYQWNADKFVPYIPIATETKESIILWTKSGDFWYSVGKNLYCFKNGSIAAYPLPEDRHNSTISSLFEDSSGRIWVGTANVGMFVLENKKLTFYADKEKLPGNDAAVKMEDREGNLWAISQQGAAIISRDGKISRLGKEQGLSDDALTCVYEDVEGNIWIGTYLRGLNRLNRQSIKFYTTEDGLGSKTIYPIFQDSVNSIWLGGILTRYRQEKFTPIAGAEGFLRNVTAIEEDRSGRFWFGYWGGVFYIEKDKITDFTRTLGFGNYMDIHQDHQTGALWFAYNAGIIRLFKDEKTHFTTNDGLPSNDVKIIHESKDGTLWFGTYGGLAKLQNGKFTSFTTENGLASNLIRSIYEDDENVLWIGSYDGGLTRLKDGKFNIYTSDDGLFNDGAFQILEDERNNLWMSCNRGIYRVAKQQLNDFADGKITRIESIALGRADGLLETECNGGQQPAGIKARDGRFWFPTQGGVAVIDPNAVKINQFAPPVIIELVTIDGENVDLNKDIEIAAGKNNLEITYTGLSFVKSEFVKFRYKLAGLQTDWVEAGARRTAYFSYLPPGTYTFQVIAVNADGVWNTEGKSISVRVIPPFYKTWWFLILLLTSLGAAAFLFYRQRVNRLEKEKIAQQNFSRQLIETQEQDRKRIARELHDGLGQSLVIIKNRAVLSLDKRDKPDRAFEQLDEIAFAASEAINEVRDITYNLRPYQIDRLGLTKAIVAMIRRAGDDIEFETEIDDLDGEFPADEEINVYRIIQESINNIIKHSKASYVIIRIKRATGAIEMFIQDNGKGFESNRVGKGFGLIGLAERARMLGGDFSIQSAPGQGTTINISLSTKDNGRVEEGIENGEHN